MKELKDDNRGAIMMTGLFMSCFLVGSLWFVIGIGDAIVFRDRMQEAADHGAFSSAALHAKGLNFISLCNLILLVAVTIHIILGMLHDIALAVCIITLGFGCGFWGTMKRIWDGYFKVLKPAAQAIAFAEKAAAIGYPAMGAIDGYQTGTSYSYKETSVTVLPLSPSLIPGGGKSGLPVTPQPMNYLCVKLTSMLDQLFQKALGRAPKIVGGVVSKVMGWIGKALQFRYCNPMNGTMGELGNAALQEANNEGNKTIDKVNEDIRKQNENRPEGTAAKDELNPVKPSGGGGGGIDPGFDAFWGKDGPMTIFSKGANGSAWFSVYAINVAPSMNDTSESKVGLAQGTSNTQAKVQKYTKTNRALGYFAQSEFYFDCDSNWASAACNEADNATFAIKWRARLKKFSIGSTGDNILNIGLTALNNLGKIDQIKGVLGNLDNRGQQIINGVTGQGDLQRAFDAFKQDSIDSDIGDVQKAFGLNPGGMYH
ncbi:MAG: hypothetical protein KIT84_30845 [Labilithrix sp.]|nr:hypothetical protein [Labilithrix sp.]MCW5815466.1 hypothetical protein [Labilithrix sp.]